MTYKNILAGALALAMLSGCGLDVSMLEPAALLMAQEHAASRPLTTRTISLHHGLLKVRVGEQRPLGPVLGDVLYFHGFADRLDNHQPLFDAWTKAGLRVISFDLPGHGENEGIKNKIDLFSFDELMDLAKTVERDTREDIRRPLIVSGWSTGGLLAVRMAQTGAWRNTGRAFKGMVLFAPGVCVRGMVGEMGFVTQETLTRNPNPPHRGPISPQSPLLTPIFATKLLTNAGLSQAQDLPQLPTLVITGGFEEDRYVFTAGIHKWTQAQRLKNRVPLVGLQFKNAFHELDNEPGTDGLQVRVAAASFAAMVAGGSANPSLPEVDAARF